MITKRITPLLILGLVFAGCGTAPLIERGKDGEPSAYNWETSLEGDHPLVGRIWSTKNNAFVSTKSLIAAANKVPLVLVGERHDQPDHHRLQAWIVANLAAPAVVGFEMLNESQEKAVNASSGSDELAETSKWDQSGWPDFAIYKPIFDAAFERGHQIKAIHPKRARLRALMMKPTSQPTDQTASQPADPATKMSAAGKAQLHRDIKVGHCGHASPKLLKAMVRAQVFKDRWMVDKIQAFRAKSTGVVIAGNGHVRKDYGMPNYIDHPSISIGLIEVSKERLNATEYSPNRYDFLWFTPRLDDVDACEKYKEALKKMQLRYKNKMKKNNHQTK